MHLFHDGRQAPLATGIDFMVARAHAAFAGIERRVGQDGPLLGALRIELQHAAQFFRIHEHFNLIA